MEECHSLQMLSPTLGTSPEGEKSWKLEVQMRNMLRSWWTQGCSKHCQSRSDLPQSRDSGPRWGASLLILGPWETETWDISLPIISFTEKEKKGRVVSDLWVIPYDLCWAFYYLYPLAFGKGKGSTWNLLHSSVAFKTSIICQEVLDSFLSLPIQFGWEEEWLRE